MNLPIGKLIKGKTVALLAVVVVLLVVDVFFSYALFSSKTEHEILLEDIKKLQDLGKEYLILKTRQEGIKKRLYTFEEGPASRIEGLLNRAGLKDKIASLKSLPERQVGQWKVISLELQLKDLAIEDLYRFLTTMKEEKEFFVRKMQIKRQFGSEKLLQAVAEIFVIKQ